MTMLHLSRTILMLAILITVAPAVAVAQDTAGTPAPTGVASLTFLWESNGGSAPLDSPYGVTVAPNGDVWVADGGGSQFQIFAPDGTFREAWGEPGSADGQLDFVGNYGGTTYPYGDVAFTPDAGFYVVDPGNHRIQHFAPDRGFLHAWGEEGRDDGQFVLPASIAIGPDGRVYVSDDARHDVQVFSADGQFLAILDGHDGPKGRLALPSGLAFARDRSLVVGDYDNHRLQVFGPEGDAQAVIGKFGDDPGELWGPNDLDIDAHGNLYVAEMDGHRIQVLTSDGQPLAIGGSRGYAPGQFLAPAGIAVRDDIVYVSDQLKQTVQAFQIDLAGSGAC